MSPVATAYHMRAFMASASGDTVVCLHNCQ